MVNAGIPIQPGAAGPGVRPGSAASSSAAMQGLQNLQGYNLNLNSFGNPLNPLPPQIQGKDIKPEMIISQIDPSMSRPRATPLSGSGSGGDRRHSEYAIAHGVGGQAQSHTESLRSQVTWQPDEEYDRALRQKLRMFQPPVRPHGRATLMQGFANGRVMCDVPLERVPEAIRAIADEAESESAEAKKKEIDPALPSAKKRKLQEVADGVDRGLVIEGDVESVGQPPVSRFAIARTHDYRSCCN